jgi:tetratricopeptide (TPR) repeat protein
LGALIFFRYIPHDIGLPEVLKYLNKAVELDPNSAITHYTKAQTAAWHEWDWVTAEREYLKSLELNPSDALCHMYYSHMLMCLRRFDEAVDQAHLGLELDPARPLVLGLYGVVMKSQGDYQSAIEHFKKAISIDSSFIFAEWNLYECYLVMGEYEKWIPWWKEVSCWDDTVKTSIEKTIYENGLFAGAEKLIEYNKKYGSPDCQMDIGSKLAWSMTVNDFGRALDYLEELYIIRSRSVLSYIASDALFEYDQLMDYPRFIELLKKINLPLPED